MVDIDTKKLGRIAEGPGHRIHGDRGLQPERHAGCEYLHVAVDDCTRLVYCEEVVQPPRTSPKPARASTNLPSGSAQGRVV